MSRRKSIAPQKTRNDQLPLTPMIDMVFLVMIFFVVNATLNISPVIDVDLPDSVSSKSSLEKEEMAIHLQIDGRVLVDGQVMDQQAVIGYLHGNLVEDGMIRILADQFLPYGDLIKLMDRLRLGGYQNISLMTDRPSDL